eukprot:3281483-Prymnesium_polylepis.1
MAVRRVVDDVAAAQCSTPCSPLPQGERCSTARDATRRRREGERRDVNTPPFTRPEAPPRVSSSSGGRAPAPATIAFEQPWMHLPLAMRCPRFCRDKAARGPFDALPPPTTREDPLPWHL